MTIQEAKRLTTSNHKTVPVQSKLELPANVEDLIRRRYRLKKLCSNFPYPPYDSGLHEGIQELALGVQNKIALRLRTSPFRPCPKLSGKKLPSVHAEDSWGSSKGDLNLPEPGNTDFVEVVTEEVVQFHMLQLECQIHPSTGYVAAAVKRLQSPQNGQYNSTLKGANIINADRTASLPRWFPASLLPCLAAPHMRS